MPQHLGYFIHAERILILLFTSILLNIIFLCTDGKISVRINLLFYLFFHRRPIQHLYVSFLFIILPIFPPSSHIIYVCFCDAQTRRPDENVVLTRNGLQDRNVHILDGTTVENKGKLILTEISHRIGAKI